MNQNHNKLIKKLISTDLKKISNPDFTLTTLERIKESMKKNSLKPANRIDLTLIYPVIGFSFLLILFSLTKVIGLWIEIENLEIILDLTRLISGQLFHPITISLMIAFTLLYLLELHLKKHGVKFTKPNNN